MLISQNLPSLIGGVSQASPALRAPSQCELADNCFLSEIDGVVKRPPSNTTAMMTNPSQPGTDPLVHFINRDGKEKYVMVFGPDNNGLQVFNLNTGTQYTSVIATGAVPGDPDINYLGGAATRKFLKALTIGDVTYVTSTLVVAAVTSDVSNQSPAPANVALVWVKSGNFSQTYVVNVNNALAGTFTTPATGAVGTDTIVTGLLASLTSHGITGPTWNISANGSYIAISRADQAPFLIDTMDSAGGQSISVIQNQVSTFAQLPPAGYHGQIVKVTGDLSGVTSAATYYVKFVSSSWANLGPNLIPGTGTWIECTGSGSQNNLDARTMPHTITRLVDPDGSITGTPGQIYFKFQRATWKPRACGDANSAPLPSFVGSTINDIFLYQDRLGVLAGTNVILTQASDFSNFFRQTALTVSDSDPIDISASHPRVVQLRHAVPWSQQMVLFGDLVQFVLGPTPGASGLTPSTVQMVASSEYESDPYVRPCPVQNMLYFPFDLNGYVGLREYYVEYYTNKHVGQEVTANLPKFMPGMPRRVASSGANEVLALTTDGDPGSIFVYAWKWMGNTLYSSEKSKSAWVRWNFDQPNTTTRIQGIQFYGQQMYVLIERVFNGVVSLYLEQISIDTAQVDFSDVLNNINPGPILTHLDRRVAIDTGTYNSVANTTTYQIGPVGMLFNPSSIRVVRRYGGSNNQTTNVGQVIPIISTDGFNVTIAGPVQSVWIGEAYTMRYRFSPFLLRDKPDQPAEPNLQGRLQIRTLTVRFNKTGYFRVEINPTYRDQNVVVWNGGTLGDSLALLGSPPGQSENEQLRCLVGCRNDNLYIDLVNDSHLVAKFQSAEWEGLYYARARRA